MGGDSLLLRGLVLSFFLHIIIFLSAIVAHKGVVGKEGSSLEVELAQMNRKELEKRDYKGAFHNVYLKEGKRCFLPLYGPVKGLMHDDRLITLGVKKDKMRHAMALLKKKWISSGESFLFLTGEG